MARHGNRTAVIRPAAPGGSGMRVDTAAVDALDALTAPRLFAYADPDPCDVAPVKSLGQLSAQDTITGGAFEAREVTSPAFRVPLDASWGPELVVYILTPRGRAEIAPRAAPAPRGMDVPAIVAKDFPAFRGAVTASALDRAKRPLLEAAGPARLPAATLRALGAAWVSDAKAPVLAAGNPFLDAAPAPAPAFVTRYRVRTEGLRELTFAESASLEPFETSYGMNQKWEGPADCPRARWYAREVAVRERRDAHTLATLTGWPLSRVLARMGLPERAPALESAEPNTEEDEPWYKRVFR